MCGDISVLRRAAKKDSFTRVILKSIIEFILETNLSYVQYVEKVSALSGLFNATSKLMGKSSSNVRLVTKDSSQKEI